MGSRHSKTNDSGSFESYVKALQVDKKAYMNARRSIDQDQGRCMIPNMHLAFCLPPNNDSGAHSKQWKESLRTQLLELENSDWPQHLINFIRVWKQNAADSTHRSEIYWLDFNYTRSLKLTLSKLNKQEQSFHSEIAEPLRQIKAIPNTAASLTRQPQGLDVSYEKEEDKINELLVETDLLEEDFYRVHERESQIERSFVYSKDNISPLRSTQSLDGDKSMDSDSTSLHLNSYKSNTFISNVPVNLTQMSHTATGENNSSSHEAMLRNVNNYKMITETLEKHFQTSSNFFCALVGKFGKFFIARYGLVVQEYNSGEMTVGDVAPYIKRAVSDVQQFIRVTYEAMNRFYRLDKLNMGKVNPNYNIFNRDNMVNFVTSILFKEPLYNTLFELLRIDDLKTEKAFAQKLQVCILKTPDQIGVPIEYCLSEITLEHFYGDLDSAIKHMPQAREAIVSAYGVQLNQPIVEVQLDFSLATGGLRTESSNRVNLNTMSYDTRERASDHEEDLQESARSLVGRVTRLPTVSRTKKMLSQPYKECISALHALDKMHSPIHKMKVIVRTAELLNLTIEKFYEKFGIERMSKLDADQTIAIFMYIVAKADIKSMITHIKIIEKFTTNNILNSISGYYATTIEACVNCIINLDSNQAPPEGEPIVEDEEVQIVKRKAFRVKYCLR